MLKKVEFYNCPDGSINIQEDDQPVRRFDETCKEVISEMLVNIQDLYPEAFEALSALYSKSVRNRPYFEYKIVHRFIRCNFGEYDGLAYDVDDFGRFNMEHVNCPLRGECRYEGIICRPKLQTELSPKETEVVKLLLAGMDKLEIAEELHVSPFTVIRHFANIRHRSGLKSTSQIIARFKNVLS